MIQTVTGAISKTDIGAVLMHEHISCSSLSFTDAFGKAWLDKEQLKNLASETLKQTKQKFNLGLMVDGTPIDLGRDLMLLKEVSELSGVKIVASTGFYYLQSIEAFNNSPQELAKWFIDECKNGVGDDQIKPGILKCATGGVGITDDNFNKLVTMAIVQKETGLPLYVHCEHNEGVAFKQLDVLLKNGAAAEKIIIGHAAIRLGAEYLESVLKMGCFICMDQCHCYSNGPTVVAQTLLKLCQKGYTDKILLSNDYCIHSDFCNQKTNGLHLTPEQHTDGLGYVLDLVYKEFIAMGGNDSDWKTMICKNAMDILDH